MNEYFEIWFCIHVSTRVKVHEKRFNTFFEHKMAAQNRSQTNPFFFFGGRTTTGRNFAPRTKNKKDSKNVYKNPMMLTSFLYIFSESFSIFVLGAKLRPVVVRPPKKKRICLREILRCHFVFKKFIKIFFMYLSTCRNMYAKSNFNIFIHFSLMKSIKWPFISCSQDKITP